MFMHKVVRQPALGGDWKEYAAQVFGVQEDIGVSHLTIAFYTPDGRGRSRFTIGFGPRAFEDLAKEMMKADPRAAIKAFAAAIHESKIAVQHDGEEETKAA